MAEYREDLDKIINEIPELSGLNMLLRSECHPEAPPECHYDSEKGVLEFYCSVCNAPVTQVAVASRQESPGQIEHVNEARQMGLVPAGSDDETFVAYQQDIMDRVRPYLRNIFMMAIRDNPIHHMTMAQFKMTKESYLNLCLMGSELLIFGFADNAAFYVQEAIRDMEREASHLGGFLSSMITNYVQTYKQSLEQSGQEDEVKYIFDEMDDVYFRNRKALIEAMFDSDHIADQMGGAKKTEFEN